MGAVMHESDVAGMAKRGQCDETHAGSAFLCGGHWHINQTGGGNGLAVC